MSRKTPRPEMVERLSKVADIDWARMAAYIDGEGSISIYLTKPCKKNGQVSLKYTVSITVANTDPRLLQWVRHLFGGGVYWYKKRIAAHRVCYQWIAVSHLASLVLNGCLPYFIVKREQADIALAVMETMQYSTHVIPEETTQRREELRLKLNDLKRQHYPEDVKFLN